MRHSKSPLSATEVRFSMPWYVVDNIKFRSKRIPGCFRKESGAVAHFARTAIMEKLVRDGVNVEAIKKYHINQCVK